MYLTKLLEAYGVDTVFGIPGVHTVELYRGLAGSNVRHITPRHEQGAGFMADGYARVSGKPGVCFIITGPGMTNIVTAMGQAYGDSIPMLVISTVNSHGHMGSGEGWLHELPNQQALVNNVAAFSYTVNRPEELAPALARAFAVFDSARPRPVHIELPINVMLAAADHLPVPEKVARLKRPAAQADEIAAAVALLDGAKAPIILAGGGAVRASKEIRGLAEKIDAPVCMTTNGRGILPPAHPLGISTSASFSATRQLIEASDVVLAIGTEFGPTDYDMYEDGFFKIPGKVIRIDIDPKHIMRTVLPEIGIVGDAATSAAQLSAAVASGKRDGAARAAKVRTNPNSDLTPAMLGDIHILEAIRDQFPDVIFVGDSTQLVYSGNLGYTSASPSSYFNSATGYGTLGYGMPAAIGAKAAAPNRPVIALAGDGGFQFSVAELASAKEAGLPIIVLLLNNNGYGEIKSYMVSKNIPTLGVDLYTPDFIGIGKAYGWTTETAGNLADLLAMVEKAASSTEPTLIVFGEDVRKEAVTKTTK
ncbi:5-guanidino-2-oxopentanoate decarboxylase [Rhizobium sp. KVB221]|uniref:5-guanidino-2-oxopentanoate decarboxylase n=2 Tax=Rhizobium setariae TaxID=2801340 RepID=A0A937CKJ1_9HYPH|nr:5-guanidino-2-oxopentanoate decarboxylase [Rhizobium setariae]MBL0372200.1 5-guanidino-2-oxopentanoate decarboxylase [Rhizobium setariae]